MRPHIVTSAVFSFTRLSTTSAASIASTTRAATALKTLAATCPTQRLFTTSSSQCDLVKPQAKHKPAFTSSSPYSTKMATPIKADSVLDLLKVRRTFYALNKDLAISTDRIQEIVKESVLHVPSSFNSQSNRVLVVFGAEHDKLWGFASDILKTIVPADAWQHTADRMNMFKAAAGTVSSPLLSPLSISFLKKPRES